MITGRKRVSYRREELSSHDEKQAAGLLASGLERLGLTAEGMLRLKKNDRRTQALAWLIKSRTVVTDEWLMRELEMGHRSNISRAIAAFRSPPDRTCSTLRKLLHKCAD